MGDLSASLPSTNSHVAEEVDPLRALTTSVSFGRFMSESLAWEKWSSFTNNRYLEEVEKYSKPGSVAEKKAYFEAHYKKIAAKKAAALQEIAVAGGDSKDSIMEAGIHDDSLMDTEVKSEKCLGIHEDHEGKETQFSVPMESAELEIDPLIIAETSNQIDEVNMPETVDGQNATNLDKTPINDAVKPWDSVSSSKKDSIASSSKSSAKRRTTQLQMPRKSTTPVHGSNSTPRTSKFSRTSIEKKRSSLKSIHMSINFGSRIDGISKASPVFSKVGNPRLVKTLDKTDKSSISKQIPNKPSVSGVSNHPSVTTKPENRSQLESSSICGRKARPPTVCTSFSFRCEERVAKRKEFFEKLEEKHKAKEAEKLQLQAKSKEGLANDFKKIRQSINLKGKSVKRLHETGILANHVNHVKKIPSALTRSAKLTSPGIFRDSSPLHPGKPPGKNDTSKHGILKNNLKPTQLMMNSLANKNTRENASPNIRPLSRGKKCSF